jgi:hypothetical protein
LEAFWRLQRIRFVSPVEAFSSARNMPYTYGQNCRGDRRTLVGRSARPAARHAADVADVFWAKLSVLTEIKTFILFFEIFGEEEVTLQN